MTRQLRPRSKTVVDLPLAQGKPFFPNLFNANQKAKLMNYVASALHRQVAKVMPRKSCQAHTLRWMSADSTALTPEQVKASVNKLSQDTPLFPWTEVEDRNAITKIFEFADFSQAWSFMSRTALLAEKMDHHPEWFNVFSTVHVTLTTHDCDGVSMKDLEMAKAMEAYAKGLLPMRND